MEYFWQSEIAYERDKQADSSFIRRKAFIDGRVVCYDRMNNDFSYGQEYYSRTLSDLKFLGKGEIYELNGIKQGRFKDMNVNEKYCVSIEDVYGVPFAESVYDGQTLGQLKENAKTATWMWDKNLKFEWTGEFRKVQQDEYFLGAHQGRSVCLNDSGIFNGAYRLIMRKCPTIKEIYGKELSELTPPKGYEFGEFRRVQAGEDWMDPYGSHVPNHAKVEPPGGAYRLILYKKASTVEDIYGAPLEKLTPPIGYRFTGEFRPPSAQDVCLHPTTPTAIQYAWVAPHEVAILDPRLILEKLPPTPTIKDVYGTDTPAIPKGWRFKEFRQIKAGEDIHYLGYALAGPISDRPLHARNEICNVANWKDGWRIVLEKEVDLSTLTYTEIVTEIVTVKDIYGDIPQVPLGYKVIGFRQPETGDVFLNSWKEVATSDRAWSGRCLARLILSPLGPR